MVKRKMQNWIKLFTYALFAFLLFHRLNYHTIFNIYQKRPDQRQSLFIVLKEWVIKWRWVFCILNITLLGKHEFNFAALLLPWNCYAAKRPSRNFLKVFLWNEKMKNWKGFKKYKIIIKTFHPSLLLYFCYVVDVKPIFHSSHTTLINFLHTKNERKILSALAAISTFDIDVVVVVAGVHSYWGVCWLWIAI